MRLYLMAEEVFCENLEKNSITSSQFTQDSLECYYLDAYFSFWHQLFEDDSELNDIQSPTIVGIIYKQFHRFNASKSSFETNLKPFRSQQKSSSTYSKRSHDAKIPVVSASPVSKISLKLKLYLLLAILRILHLFQENQSSRALFFIT